MLDLWATRKGREEDVLYKTNRFSLRLLIPFLFRLAKRSGVSSRLSSWLRRDAISNQK